VPNGKAVVMVAVNAPRQYGKSHTAARRSAATSQPLTTPTRHCNGRQFR